VLRGVRKRREWTGNLGNHGVTTMSTANVHNLPPELREMQLETEAHARTYGLDFYETIFEVCDYDEISEIAALGGFPNRYPHWRFGMEYQQLSKGYRYGLQKIYEMVRSSSWPMSTATTTSSRTTSGSARPTAR
jgi:spore cortex formation protein SpoVR/YcgB (stage V sporulation)